MNSAVPAMMNSPRFLSNPMPELPRLMHSEQAIHDLRKMGILTRSQVREFLSWVQNPTSLPRDHPLGPTLSAVWLWSLMPGSSLEQ